MAPRKIPEGATVIPRTATALVYCPVCRGISVQLALESLSSLPWNACPVCSGIRNQTYMFADYVPSWNVSPGRNVLVFHDNEAGHVAELVHWGFLPYWADAKARRPINARIETAATSPYFRHAWRGGRCVVPVDGWYEWQETPTGKIPYFIYRQDDATIFLAGLYEINHHENTSTFAILTTEAEGTLRDIHEREPVALSAEIARQWIRRDLTLPETSEVAHQSLPFNSFHWHTISSRVNNPKNDGADLIIPQA